MMKYVQHDAKTIPFRGAFSESDIYIIHVLYETDAGFYRVHRMATTGPVWVSASKREDILRREAAERGELVSMKEAVELFGQAIVEKLETPT